MLGNRIIAIASNIMVYYDYWHTRLQEHRTLIDKLHRTGNVMHLSELDRKYGQTLEHFVANVLNILSPLADTLRTRKWGDFLEYGFEDPTP